MNLTTAAIAKMNLFLHEIEDFKIVRGDTLRSPGLRKPDGSISQFDLVIANPPFSLENWGSDTWAADGRSFCGVPPAKNGDFAWIQHMVASMSSGSGRVAVVLPHGALVRTGVEARIRRCLVEEGWLDAVIGLPHNLFYNTDIAAAILIFCSSGQRRAHQQVLFADASQSFQRGVNQHTLGDDDIAEIVGTYRDGAAQGRVRCRTVTAEDIAVQNYSFHLGRYLGSSHEGSTEVPARRDLLMAAQRSRLTSEQRMVQAMKEAGLWPDGIEK